MNKKIILPMLSGFCHPNGNPRGLTTGEFINFNIHQLSHSQVVSQRRYYYVLGDPDLLQYLSQLTQDYTPQKDDIRELVRSITRNQPLTRLINK